MRLRPEIFAISTILLVPFVYGISVIPDVCAVDPAPGYLGSNTCGAKTTNPETGVTQQTCCWKERTGTSQAPGPEKIICQTCKDVGKPGENLVGCETPVTQAPAPLKPELSGTLEEGGVIEGNTTDRLPGGGVFKVPGTNATFAENDSRANNTVNTLAELQSEAETAEDSPGEDNTEEEQDENEESEEDQ